jgi:hypothetical protein
VVPVNTVPACIAMAMVGKRLFGLFTRIPRMSERPQLGRSAPNEAVRFGYWVTAGFAPPVPAWQVRQRR